MGATHYARRGVPSCRIGFSSAAPQELECPTTAPDLNEAQFGPFPAQHRMTINLPSRNSTCGLRKLCRAYARAAAHDIGAEADTGILTRSPHEAALLALIAENTKRMANIALKRSAAGLELTIDRVVGRVALGAAKSQQMTAFSTRPEQNGEMGTLHRPVGGRKSAPGRQGGSKGEHGRNRRRGREKTAGRWKRSGQAPEKYPARRIY
jgi:hypothetical protein